MNTLTEQCHCWLLSSDTAGTGNLVVVADPCALSTSRNRHRAALRSLCIWVGERLSMLGPSHWVGASLADPDRNPFLQFAIVTDIDHLATLKFLWLCNHHYYYNYINVCCQSTDINECTEGISGCHQHCTNTVPGYTCSCDTGYTLNKDGHACDGENHSMYEYTASHAHHI